MERIHLSSIRVRLLGLVALALLPVLVLTLVTYIKQSQHERDHASYEAQMALTVISADYEALIESTRLTLATLSSVPTVLERRGGACSSLLAGLLAIHPAFANLGATDPEGRIYCSAVPMPDDSVSNTDRLYFKKAVALGGFAVGGYQIGRITQKPTINMGYPVIVEGEIKAVVYAAIDLGWLRRTSSAKISLPDASLTVTDQTGAILVKTDDPNNGGGKAIDDPQLREMMDQDYQGSRMFQALDGAEMLYSFATIERPGSYRLRAAIGVPAKLVFADANSELMKHLAWLLAISMITFVAAWFGGDLFIVRKVRALIAAANRMAHGDLTVRLDVNGARGEIDELARAFNEMGIGLEESHNAQMQAEQALRERNEALTESRRELEQINFLASHHLHEPLMKVWAAVEMLLRRGKNLDESSRNNLEDILASVMRMNTVITDLLVYSQEDLGMVPTDFGEVLDRVASKLGAKIKDTRAKVTWDRMPTIDSNPEQMGQVLEHLIDNALNFRSLPAPRVHVGAVEDGESWIFSVSDNGIGIDAAHHDDIFVIFKREHTGASFLGTGIGLAICKKIVERHNGQIWLTSEVGQGTTFYVRIPAKQKLRRLSDKDSSANDRKQAAA